jgi:hypothetical protein
VTARSADAMSKQGGKPGKISLEDHINLEVRQLVADGELLVVLLSPQQQCRHV